MENSNSGGDSGEQTAIAIIRDSSHEDNAAAFDENHPKHQEVAARLNRLFGVGQEREATRDTTGKQSERDPNLPSSGNFAAIETTQAEDLAVQQLQTEYGDAFEEFYQDSSCGMALLFAGRGEAEVFNFIDKSGILQSQTAVYYAMKCLAEIGRSRPRR